MFTKPPTTISVHDWNKQLGGKMQGIIDDMRGVTIPHEEAVQIGLKTEEEVQNNCPVLVYILKS